LRRGVFAMTEHGVTFDIYSSISAISRISVIQDIFSSSVSLSLSLHQMISFSPIGSRQRMTSPRPSPLGEGVQVSSPFSEGEGVRG
jgi:hypothetical protein